MCTVHSEHCSGLRVWLPFQEVSTFFLPKSQETQSFSRKSKCVRGSICHLMNTAWIMPCTCLESKVPTFNAARFYCIDLHLNINYSQTNEYQFLNEQNVTANADQNVENRQRTVKISTNMIDVLTRRKTSRISDVNVARGDCGSYSRRLKTYTFLHFVSAWMCGNLSTRFFQLFRRLMDRYTAFVR